MTTLLPAPTFGGQSPGRGDAGRGAGGGEGGGTGVAGVAADEEPQPAAALAIPIAAMARNMAEPPTARPMEARNSRRAMRGSASDMLLLSYPLFFSDRAQPLKFPSASLFTLPIVAVLLLTATTARTETLTIAVASNFAPTARELAAVFEAESGYDVRLSVGSTGKLYAQIVNGAPYDVFLAADAERPARLQQASLIVPGSRFVYAIGALAFWSSDRDLDGCTAVLRQMTNGKVAVANPAHAPYGKAAVEFLKQASLYDVVADRLVFGENIAQTYQFVATGNADYGFVALSMLSDEQRRNVRCGITMNDVLRQEAVLLGPAVASEPAQRFMTFLKSPAAHRIIRLRGYHVPDS